MLAAVAIVSVNFKPKNAHKAECRGFFKQFHAIKMSNNKSGRFDLESSSAEQFRRRPRDENVLNCLTFMLREIAKKMPLYVHIRCNNEPLHSITQKAIEQG